MCTTQFTCLSLPIGFFPKNIQFENENFRNLFVNEIQSVWIDSDLIGRMFEGEVLQVLGLISRVKWENSQFS